MYHVVGQSVSCDGATADPSANCYSVSTIRIRFAVPDCVSASQVREKEAILGISISFTVFESISLAASFKPEAIAGIPVLPIGLIEAFAVGNCIAVTFAVEV